jgi:TatD DNase family protein
MRANGVTHALTISTTLATFPAVLSVARSQPNLWCSAGVHPDERRDGREVPMAELLEMADDPKVVAIGETGLDYYRVEGDTEWQRERFRTHIRAARACGKPLVIHTREAAEDTLRIMREEDAGAVGGVMHCFTETWDIARAAIDLGFHISLSGIVTFKNAHTVKEVARQLPLERMLVETDSPYLAPVPYRGKMNQPGFRSPRGGGNRAPARHRPRDDRFADQRELLRALSPCAFRVKAPNLLAYCRAGFERECAQELTAAAEEVGGSGFVKARPDSGFALFQPHQEEVGIELGQRLELARLVFPRQLVRVGELLQGLPPGDRCRLSPRRRAPSASASPRCGSRCPIRTTARRSLRSRER